MTQVSFNIYHNTKCSKSRKALEILNSKTNNYDIIKYLENGINVVELNSILSLNQISKNEIIRTNEIIFKELNLPKNKFSKDEIVNSIIQFPILLHRPIVSKYVDNILIKSIIGRPPEKVLSLFD